MQLNNIVIELSGRDIPPKCLLLSSRYLKRISNGLIALSYTLLSSFRVASAAFAKIISFSSDSESSRSICATCSRCRRFSGISTSWSINTRHVEKLRTVVRCDRLQLIAFQVITSLMVYPVLAICLYLFHGWTTQLKMSLFSWEFEKLYILFLFWPIVLVQHF